MFRIGQRRTPFVYVRKRRREMIQDIGEHKWDITYKYNMPERESRIMAFCKGKLLVKSHEGEISFPMAKEIEINKYNCIYLFKLDDEEYFRIEVKNEKDLELEKFTWESRSFFRKVGPKEKVLAAITGMHLDGWYTKNRFCGACGQKLENDDKERMLYCKCCGNQVYPRINPAVIVAVTDGDRILLTKYRDREYKKYALIAGFAEVGESFEDTVRREVMEEVGLRVKNIRYYKSQPWGFSDNILAGYFCQVDGDSNITMDRQELSLAEWVHRSDIPLMSEGLSLTHEMMEKFAVDKEKI